MELEYVAKAVRRFWPVVLASLILGVIAGQLLRPSSPPRYESTALVLVVPSAESGLGNAAVDRYVASQLVVLESPPLAARAAELAGVPLTAAQAVSFVQIAGTDVVRIIASSPSAADAQAVANAYVEAYVERTGTGSGADQQPEPSDLDTSLGEIERQLDDVDQRIQEAMAPYVQANEADVEVAIPTIEQVAPAIATEREVLLETYRNLLGQRTALEFEPQAPSGSQVIQRAELPTAPIVPSSGVVTLALPVVGLLFGICAATVLARSSRRVLDGAEVSEKLGVPFAATLPAERALRARSLFQLQQLPDDYEVHIGELCVQVEAHGKLDTPLAVLVTGSHRVSGTTTLAGAMAACFGKLGSKVLLVDLDFDQPDLSKCFGARGDGISALVDVGTAGRTARDGRLTEASVLTPTPLPNVAVVGRAPGLGQTRPQRADLVIVLDTAVEYADVVIFDAGPMLAAPAAAVLAPHCDAVVVAVPVWSQERSSLQVIARQLAPLKARVLPVSMPRLRRSGRLPVETTTATSPETDDDEVMSPTVR